MGEHECDSRAKPVRANIANVQTAKRAAYTKDGSVDSFSTHQFVYTDSEDSGLSSETNIHADEEKNPALLSALDKRPNATSVEALQQCLTTNTINTDIVGEGLQLCQRFSDVVVSASRRTASSYMAAATRALKRANAASFLHHEGGDDYGHKADNIPSEPASPSAAEAYIRSLRPGSDDTSGVEAARRDTNKRVKQGSQSWSPTRPNCDILFFESAVCV